MSQTVDQRIVEMQIDSEEFERGAKKVMGVMDKLKAATDFRNTQSAVNNFSTDHMSREFEKLSENIDHSVNGLLPTLQRGFFTKISDLVNDTWSEILRKTTSGIRELKNQIENLSFGQMEPGWGKLEEKTASVQTLLNSTGLSLEQVNGYLADLMWYSDETSFGFTDMTSALATMTSTGGDIKKLIPMIMGMGNAVAFAGKSASEFKRVIFNLNQSYSAGALTLLDWRSVQQAGAASKQLTQALIDAGVALGTIKEGEVTINNFADSLKSKWATSEVMEKAFAYFGDMSVQARELVKAGDFDNAYEAYDYLSKSFEKVQADAAKAAQEAKSFSEAIAATKDAVSTGWMNIFESIFGDYGQQKNFWSGVTEELYGIFTGPIKRIQSFVDTAFGSGQDGYGKFKSVLTETGTTTEDFYKKLEETLKQNGKDVDALVSEYGSLEKALREGTVSGEEFKEALSSITVVNPENTAKNVVGTIEDRIAELKEISLAVINGDYGDGEQRKAALEAAGYNYEIVQRMADWVALGHSLDIDQLGAEYPTLLAMIRDEMVQTGNYTEEELKNINELLGDTDALFAEVQKKSGTELWEDGVVNVLSTISSILDAISAGFDRVFGSPEDRGSGFRKLLETFYEWTESLEITEERFNKISDIAAGFFEKVKEFGGVLKSLLQTAKVLGITALQIISSFAGGLLGKGAIEHGIQGIADGTKLLVNALPKLNTIVQTIGKTLSASLPKIQAMAYNVGLSVRIVATSLMDMIPSLEQGFAKGVVKILEKLGELVPGWDEALQKWRSKIIDSVGIVTAEGEKVLPEWDELGLNLTKIAYRMFETIGRVFGKEGLGKTFLEFKFWIEDVYNAVKEFLATDITAHLSNAFETIKKFFTDKDLFQFKISDLFGGQKAVDEATGALSQVQTFFGGMDKSIGTKEVTGNVAFKANALFPTQKEIDGEADTFFGRVFRAIQESFQKIQWGQAFNLGKLVAMGYGLFNLNKLLTSIRTTVDPKKNGLLGVVSALKTTIANIGAPFFQFSKKIEREGRADEMIKLASAIGILSLALIGLSTIDEQTLFNVAAVMSGLMLLLKMLSGAGQGIQIFSNNAKKITGETTNSIHVLEKLDFEKLKDKLVSITLTGNVIPPAMGALMGIATVIAAIGYVFIKIKDIKDVNDVMPALQIIGGIMLSIGVLAGLVGALGPRMKGLGGTLVGLGIFFALIGHTFKTLSDIQFSLSGIFAVIMAVIAAAVLLHTLGDQLNKTLAENMSVGALMSFAALIVSVGLLFKMIASSLTVLSVLNKDGLMTASVSILLVSLGIAAIVYAISKVPPEASMLKAAASLMVAALAIQMMMVPIGIIAAAIKWLNMETALLHAAEGVAVFIAAMALIIGLLSKFGGDNLTTAAGSLALLSLTFIGISTSLLLLKDMDPESLIPIAIALGVLFAELSVAMGILTSLDHIENALVVAAGLTGASLAFVALGGALRMIGEVNSEGVKSAAIALGILFAVLVGAVAGLSFLKNPAKLLSVATALLVAAAAIDVLALGLAGLSYAFVQVIQNGSWESLGEKTKAFAAALDPIAPYLIGIVVALGAFVAVGALVGDKIGMMGLGFAGVGAGVLALVYSFTMLPEAVQGIVNAMDVIKENAWTIVEFITLVLGAILTAMVLKKAEFAKTAISLLEACATAITSAKTLATLGSAITTLGAFILTFLIGATPGLVDKVVQLMITFFESLATAINSSASKLSSAIEKMVVALVNVIVQTFVKIFFDALGGIVNTVVKPIAALLTTLGDKLGFDWAKNAGDTLSSIDFFEYWHNDAMAFSDMLQKDADIVFAKIDETVAEYAETTAETAVTVAEETFAGEQEAMNAAVEQFASDAVTAGGDAAAENAEDAVEKTGESIKDKTANWIRDHAQELNLTSWFSADGTVTPESQADLDAYVEQFTNMASEGGDEAGSSFFPSFIAGADPDSQENSTLLSGLWSDFKTNVLKQKDDLGETGEEIGGSVTKGMAENIPEASKEYVELTEKQLNEQARKHEQDFKDIGIYAMWQVKDGYFIAVPEKAAEMALNTVNGLSDAVFNEKDKLHALGELLFQWTKEGYEDAADINSPSKVMEQEMGYTIDGIVKGAKRHGHRAFQAFEKVGDDMMLAMRNSMSMLALAVDQDYDLQPTITPVVDLGAAVDGARALKNMMRGGELRQVLDSYRSMDGLAVSGAVFNYTNQNAPVTSAIRDLSNRMDRIGSTLDNDRNFNVGIRVEHMAVRDEGDIKAISRQLAKEVRVALRQKGR